MKLIHSLNTALTMRSKLALVLAILSAATVAYAQGPGYNRTPSSAVAAIATNCGNTIGNTCLVTDGLTVNDCTTGGGTEDVLCLRSVAGTWVVVADDAGNAAIPGTTADTFGLDTDGDNLTLDPQVGGLTLDRAAAGTVTLTATDDDATAALTVLPGGAAAMTVGGASTTALTVTTDSTGNGEVVLPDSSVSNDELSGSMLITGIFCGDLPNNTTTYASPVSGYPSGIIYTDGLTATDLSYGLAGTGCAAEDSTTEATADEIMFTGRAVKIHGMYCRVTGSGSNGVVLAVRSAAAALTPAVTCTVATAQTECLTTTPTTTDIAANATLAVQAVVTEDLSAQDYWCMVQMSIQ